MAAINLYLFGLPRIVYQGRAIEVERRKAVALMTYLALLTKSRSHQHPLDTLCADCLNMLEYAIALYHDDFLTGFTLSDSAEYDDWQMFQRGWLRRECTKALRKVAAYYGGCSGELAPSTITHGQSQCIRSLASVAMQVGQYKAFAQGIFDHFHFSLLSLVHVFLEKIW